MLRYGCGTFREREPGACSSKWLPPAPGGKSQRPEMTSAKVTANVTQRLHLKALSNGTRRALATAKGLYTYHQSTRSENVATNKEHKTRVNYLIHSRSVTYCLPTSRFGQACRASRTPGILNASKPRIRLLSRYRGWRPYSCSRSGIFFNRSKKLLSVKPKDKAQQT